MTTAAVLAQMGSNNTTFPPTLLLIQTHNVTGKKYFCKLSTLYKANYYKGSGIHWKRHLKKHGRDVTTGVLGFYLDRQRCVDAALKFSKENNIVESDEWLNLIEENGLDGAGSGENNVMYGRAPSWKGKKRPEMKGLLVGALNPRYGKPSPMRGKKNIGASMARKGKPRPEGGGKKPHAVIGTSPDGVETTYPSVADAGRAMNGCRTGIHQCCNGKAKTAHGYKWRYAEEQK